MQDQLEIDRNGPARYEKINWYFFVDLIDGIVSSFHALLYDGGHLTLLNSACYITSVCYKTLFSLSCDMRQHVLLCGGCKMALHPIVQIHFSHFSIKSFEAKSSTEDQQTRCQRRVWISTPSTSIFERLGKIRFSRKNQLDRLAGAICEIFAVGYSQETSRRVSKDVLKCATLYMQAMWPFPPTLVGHL